MVSCCVLVKAENVAKQWSVTREDQDLFALQSQQKCEAARVGGAFKAEIVPVAVQSRQGESLVLNAWLSTFHEFYLLTKKLSEISRQYVLLVNHIKFINFDDLFTIQNTVKVIMF